MTTDTKPVSDHLRWIVEKQPSCLMRIGTDGVVLAANDAALALLGAESHPQVLGHSLTPLIAPTHQDAWLAFLDKVGHGAPQSCECDLHGVTGATRSVVLHGVPLLDHEDGIPSLLLSARDAGALRGVEAALHESERLRQLALAHARQQAAGADNIDEIRSLRATIEQLETDRDQLERAVAELPRLQKLLKQGRTLMQDLQMRLNEATKERDALKLQLGDSHSTSEHVPSELETAQKSTADAHERDLALLRAQLERAAETQDGLARRLAELDQQCVQLRQERDAADQRAAGHQQQIEQLHASIAQMQRETQQAQQDLEETRRDAEQRRHELDHRRHEVEQLRQQIEETRRERDERDEQLMVRVREHDEAMTAERERHRAEVERVEGELTRAHEELNAAHQELAAVKQDVVSLRGEAEKVAADHARAGERIAEMEDAARQLAAERDALRRTIDEEQAVSTGLRADIERKSAALDHTAKELERVSGDLASSEAARTQLAQVILEHEAQRSSLEQELKALTAQLNEVEHALSDQRLEVQSMDIVIRDIEPLAAAGRLSADVSRELLSAIADIDARSACLTAENATGSPSREQIEQLRSDAVKAGSLARQIVLASRVTQAEERHADSA